MNGDLPTGKWTHESIVQSPRAFLTMSLESPLFWSMKDQWVYLKMTFYFIITSFILFLLNTLNHICGSSEPICNHLGLQTLFIYIMSSFPSWLLCCLIVVMLARLQAFLLAYPDVSKLFIYFHFMDFCSESFPPCTVWALKSKGLLWSVLQWLCEADSRDNYCVEKGQKKKQTWVTKERTI